MESIAEWVAPAATMIAAMMTAANLGAKITGFGFVVFTIGSIAWCIIGASSGQQNLVLTNGFLTAVNVFGIWRWLGRQARYEKGGRTAAEASSGTPSPTLRSMASLVGADVVGADGEKLGAVVDAMLECRGGSLAYVVLSEGGVAGAGAKLRPLDPEALSFSADQISCRLTADDIARLPELEVDHWPARLPRAARR
jgi:PRC-barrel domain